MLTKVDPNDTMRAKSYEMFAHRKVPVLTVVKKLNITNIVRQSKKGYKLNCIMLYLIGKAAHSISEFRYNVYADGLYYSDDLCVDMVVKCKDGNLSFCDVEYNKDFFKFEENYKTSFKQCFEKCEHVQKTGFAKVCTSVVTLTDYECLINGYDDSFNLPFCVWGKYKKYFLKKEISFSFQFHHAQMDGEQACKFLVALQNEMKNFKLPRRK